MNGVVGLPLQYLVYHLLNLLIGNGTRSARARFIVQSQQPQFPIASTRSATNTMKVLNNASSPLSCSLRMQEIQKYLLTNLR